MHWQNASLLPPFLAITAALILAFTKVVVVVAVMVVINMADDFLFR